MEGVQLSHYFRSIKICSNSKKNVTLVAEKMIQKNTYRVANSIALTTTKPEMSAQQKADVIFNFWLTYHGHNLTFH
jgi:hypothetical protein